MILPDSPPPGSLAAEMRADAAHKATAKEREAAQLDELIRNNTDPDGRSRHVSTKDKKAAQASSATKDKKAAHASNSKSPLFLCSLPLIPFFPQPSILYTSPRRLTVAPSGLLLVVLRTLPKSPIP